MSTPSTPDTPNDCGFVAVSHLVEAGRDGARLLVS